MLVEHIIHEYSLIDYYDMLAKHVNFKPGEVAYKKTGKTNFKIKDLGYESMNIIYNLDDNEVTILAVYGHSLQLNTLDLTPAFLKKKEIEYVDKELG